MIGQTFRYRAWGIAMAVPMEVPELTIDEEGQDPDWELRIANSPFDCDCEPFRLPNGAPAALAGVRLAYVDASRAPSGLRPSQLRSIVAPALRLRGCVVLHGCAFEHGGRAIVLAGLSASGKSTLAAAACAEGARLLGDELCAIAWNDAHPVVLPGSRLLALRPDAVSLSGLSQDAGPGQQGEAILWRNGRVLTRVDTQAEECVLHALCLLDWNEGGPAQLHRITGQETLPTLVTMRYQPGTGPRLAISGELPLLARLGSACTLLQLERSTASSPQDVIQMLFRAC